MKKQLLVTYGAYPAVLQALESVAASINDVGATVHLSYEPIIQEPDQPIVTPVPGAHFVVDDTPEVRAKLDAMIASIGQARCVLIAVAGMPDPTAALMSIYFAAPAPADLLAQPAIDSRQAGLPFMSDPFTPEPAAPAPATTDDDEL